MEKRKLNELYIFTTILCCFVVMTHLTSYPVTHLLKGSWQHMLFYFVNKFIQFTVPGFIFLSGLKLMYSYQNKEFRFGSFFKKRFTKIIIPYMIWYCIYYAFFRQLNFVQKKNITQHVFSLLIGDLVSPFYFITIIFQFYILFGLIFYLFQKWNHKIIVGVVFVFQLLYLQYTFLPYEDRFFGTYLIYFILGCFAALHLEQWKTFLKKYSSILFVIFLGIGAWYLYFAYMSHVFGTAFPFWRIISCFYIISAILVFYSICIFYCETKEKFFFRQFVLIEEASYFIYLTHSFAIYCCQQLYYSFQTKSIDGQFLFTTIMTYPIVFLACIGYCQFWRKKEL